MMDKGEWKPPGHKSFLKQENLPAQNHICFYKMVGYVTVCNVLATLSPPVSSSEKNVVW